MPSLSIMARESADVRRTTASSYDDVETGDRFDAICVVDMTGHEAEHRHRDREMARDATRGPRQIHDLY